MANLNDIKSFAELLSVCGIEIPMLQRDYVQGRIHDISKLQLKKDALSKEIVKRYIDERDKRDSFVTQLINSLRDPISSPTQLTFIYGNKEKTGSTNNSTKQTESFLPLDGQQRLTTLFLLSWILIFKIKTDNQTEYNQLQQTTEFIEFNKGLSSFNYKTRPSSGEFCSSLIKESIQAYQADISISKNLYAQSWFNDDWKLDPTVLAMLQMLDELERQLNFCKTELVIMFENLLQGKGICFELLDMKTYKLTDSLYIKMNARGKQLTSFENWKSEFIKFLGDFHKDVEYKGPIENDCLQNTFKGNRPTLKDYFAFSIEHKWTDMFWGFCKQQIEEHDKDIKSRISKGDSLSKKECDCFPVIDDFFSNILNTFHRIIFYVLNPDKNEAKDFQPTKLEREKIFTSASTVRLLFEFLDLLYELQENKAFDKIFYVANDNMNYQYNKVRLFDAKDVNLFKLCCMGESTARTDTLLFSLLLYTRFFGTSVDADMQFFMRYVRNCLEDKNNLSTQDVNIVNDYNINDINSKRIYAFVCNLIEKKYISNSANFWNCSKDQMEIEDMDFIRGNFKPQVQITPDLNSVIKAWNEMEEYDKICLLIAYGFQGKEVMTCARGKVFLFGNNERWRPIFMHTHQGQEHPLTKTLNNILNDYEKQKGVGVTKKEVLETLLSNKKKHHNCFDFIYYALNYRSFMDSSAQNKKNYHYFAINGEMDDLDISSMAYSSQPARAYHTDPIIYAVADGLLKSKPDQALKNVYLYYRITGRDRASLEIYETPSWDETSPIGRFEHITGSHCSYNGLSQSGWKYTDLQKSAPVRYLPDNKDEDRIQSGINFVKSIYTNHSFFNKC